MSQEARFGNECGPLQHAKHDDATENVGFKNGKHLILIRSFQSTAYFNESRIPVKFSLCSRDRHYLDLGGPSMCNQAHCLNVGAALEPFFQRTLQRSSITTNGRLREPSPLPTRVARMR